MAVIVLLLGIAVGLAGYALFWFVTALTAVALSLAASARCPGNANGVAAVSGAPVVLGFVL